MLALQPTHHESEHRRRRLVHPLHVVHRDDRRALTAQFAYSREQGKT